jgi:hypothetical protein
MTTDFNDESSEASGIQPDPAGDAHGADPETDFLPTYAPEDSGPEPAP